MLKACIVNANVFRMLKHCLAYEHFPEYFSFWEFKEFQKILDVTLMTLCASEIVGTINLNPFAYINFSKGHES